MTEMVRLRVFFEEASIILSRSKKKEGLERCWVLLKPHIQTVSDLASHLLYSFSLFRTCPNGIVLSMDGFVLPPSESTCIFKDKDIVCVKKKESERSTEDARPLHTFLLRDSPSLIEDIDSDDEDIEESPEIFNKEVIEEMEGYEEEKEDEDNEDGIDQANEDAAATKKRKASKKIRGSKKKKSKLTSTKGLLTADVLKGKRQRSSQPEANGQGYLDISSTHAETKKLPSRSARRKKAKRQWLREQVKREKDNQIQSRMPEIEEHGPPENADNKASDADQGQIEDNDMDDDVVPILVKPGHIRFEPLRKNEDQVGQQNHSPVLQGLLHWNGITSKKKGQKWGIEKISFSRTNVKSSYFQPPAILCNEEGIPRDVAIDFDKLSPCRSFPKEGDVIAYCMLELSESWTPEPSSFRVGKVLIPDPVSNRIKLAPVPEYPFEFKKTIDDETTSSFQPDDSPYNEDGTLEIDYSLLLDVRLIKQWKMDSTKADTVDEHPIGLTEVSHENGDRNVWEEINQTLSAKKAQLSQENGWKTDDSSCKRSWSYKGLRRGALGPTVAYLRDQNGFSLP